MLVNSSSNSSLDPVVFQCLHSEGAISASAFACTKTVLILPLSVLVLYLGQQQWQRQRSFKAMSHSDIFLYHLAIMELIGVSGVAFYFCALRLPVMLMVGICLQSLAVCGEIQFHLLTCVERYLAVIHPITYLGLKKAGGVWIRNICLGCVWLLSFGWSGLIVLYFPNIPIIPFFSLIAICFMVVSFCSFSVLCVLIRPGPGNVGGNRERVDPSKKRAFHTIVVITGALWVLFVGYLVCVSLGLSTILSYNHRCLVMAFGLWLSLPSSLVLPLLFLHRAGKLTCC